MNIVKDEIQIDTDKKIITTLNEVIQYDLQKLYSACIEAFDDKDLMDEQRPIKYVTYFGHDNSTEYEFRVVNGWTFRRGRNITKDGEILGVATVRDLRSRK